MIAQSRELADDREKLVKKMDSHIDKEKKRKDLFLFAYSLSLSLSLLNNETKYDLPIKGRALGIVNYMVFRQDRPMEPDDNVLQVKCSQLAYAVFTRWRICFQWLAKRLGKSTCIILS